MSDARVLLGRNLIRAGAAVLLGAEHVRAAVAHAVVEGLERGVRAATTGVWRVAAAAPLASVAASLLVRAGAACEGRTSANPLAEAQVEAVQLRARIVARQERGG